MTGEGARPTDYGAMAPAYARLRSAQPLLLGRLVAAIAPGARVLEVGCGTGNYVTEIARRTDCTCCAVDPSAEMLAQLATRAAPVDARAGRAEALPFDDAAFDFVYSVDVIHHVADRAAAYREAHRVLRAGGRVCTATDSEAIIRGRQPLALYFPETIDVEMGRYPSIETLRAHMSDAGFESLEEETSVDRFFVTDATPFRERVFSSLLYIGEDAYRRGLDRLERDLERGPVPWVWRSLLLSGKKPA